MSSPRPHRISRRSIRYGRDEPSNDTDFSYAWCMPDTWGKRQRRDVKAKKAAATEERRIARNKRREDRAAGLIEPGPPLATEYGGTDVSRDPEPVPDDI